MLVSNARFVNDGASGSNGLSVLSAKAVHNRNRFNDSVILNANKKFFGTPDARAELLPKEYRDDVAKLEADGMSHTKASVIAGLKETKERIDAIPQGSEAVADAIASNPEPESPFTGSGKVQAKPITYSDWSDAARYFGMNQETAYAEHMANTAHQREVADLRAAGLNPVLGVGSGASGITGHVAYSGGASSGRKLSDDSVLVDTIGATVGFLASLLAGDTAGRFASKAATGLGKLFEIK